MKFVLDIAATPNKINGHLDLLCCFQHSALSLYGAAKEQQQEINNGEVIIESSNFNSVDEYLVIALYLFRHAIELAVKALLEAITFEEMTGHNIKNLYQKLPKVYKHILSEFGNINGVFEILTKFDILEDEQLFRYHVDKRKKYLNQVEKITNKDCDALNNAIQYLRYACEHCFNTKYKGDPANMSPYLNCLEEYDLILIKNIPLAVVKFVSCITPDGLFEVNEISNSYTKLLSEDDLKQIGFEDYLKKAKTNEGRSIRKELNHERLRKLLKKIIEKNGSTLFYIQE